MRVNFSFIAAVCAVSACGGGDKSQSDVSGLTPAAGAAGQSGAGGASSTPAARSSGSTAGAPPAKACDAPAARTLLSGATALSLSADEGFLYFIDRGAGPSDALGPSGAVKRVAIDSGAVTTLFEPAAAQHIVQMRQAGSDLFLFMAGTGNTAEKGFVYRLPVSGGTPAFVGPSSMEGYNLDNPALAAVNSRAAYMVGANGNTLYEITLADGVERLVIETDSISRPQLLGDTLWYATQDGAGDIYRLNAATAGAEPELALAGGCGQGSVLNGSTYLVTGDKVICGSLLSIGERALGGGAAEEFWSPPLELAAGELSPIRLESNDVYIVGGQFGARVPLGGGTARYFACEGLTLEAVTTNGSSILWGRGGFGAGLPTNQVLQPSRFKEVLVTPK